MKSSLEKPLAYFESITDNESFTNLVEGQIYHSDIVSHKYIDSVNIQYVIMDDYGNYEQREMHISFFVLPSLRREYENTKNLLYGFSINNSNEVVKRYLEIQVKFIQNIINNKTEFIKSYSFFLPPLRGIINYINNILLLEDMPPFELDESPLDNVDIELYNNSIDSNVESNKTAESIIISVFGYMNGLNEKREKILNSDDYNLLIDYITYFISNESLPEIERKLRPNISNDQLSFSFWVLHKEIYTTKFIKPMFFDFLKLVFENFNDIEVSSLRKIFGVKSRVVKDTFLPEIIKKYL